MSLRQLFRSPRTPREFLLRHESTIRRLVAEEMQRGECTAWLSRAVEYLDERDQIEEFNREH